MREKNEDERKEREKVRVNIWERENPVNKQIIKNFGIDVCTVSNMRRYYNMFQIFDTFRTPHEAWIVVFGVSNAKYLAFDTPDENALIALEIVTWKWFESSIGSPTFYFFACWSMHTKLTFIMKLCNVSVEIYVSISWTYGYSFSNTQELFFFFFFYQVRDSVYGDDDVWFLFYYEKCGEKKSLFVVKVVFSKHLGC